MKATMHTAIYRLAPFFDVFPYRAHGDFAIRLGIHDDARCRRPCQHVCHVTRTRWHNRLNVVAIWRGGEQRIEAWVVMCASFLDEFQAEFRRDQIRREHEAGDGRRRWDVIYRGRLDGQWSRCVFGQHDVVE